MISFKRLPSAKVFLWLALAGWAVTMSWLSVHKAAVYDLYSSDLGHMWQSAWNVAHGQGFEFSYHAKNENVPRLTIHADYLLILLSPLTWLTSDPMSFLIVQSVVAAAGGWFIWSIARLRLPPGLSLLLGLGWLAYVPLQSAVLWQFHTVTLAVTFLLALAEALLRRRRWWVVAIWFSLSLLSKEQTGFVAGLLAASMLSTQRRWRTAAVYALLGAAFTAAQFFIVIPTARGDQPHFVFTSYYRDLGRSSEDVFSRLSEPALIATRLTRPEIGRNLVELFSPLAFVPAVSLWTIGGLISVVPHWVSANVPAVSLGYHNHVLAIPWIWVGTILTLDWILRRRPGLNRWIIVLLTVSIGWSAWHFGKIPGTRAPHIAWSLTDPAGRMIRQAAGRIPPRATVAYSYGLDPSFRSHPTVYLLPTKINQVDYLAIHVPNLIVSVGNHPVYRVRQGLSDLLAWTKANPAFEPVFETSRGGIYRRNFEIPSPAVPASIGRIRPGRYTAE